MTYGEYLMKSSPKERIVYVYMWMYKTDNGDLPFYVGMGRGNRWLNKSSRTKPFKEFLSSHTCYPILCAINLNEVVAREVEIRIKDSLRSRGIAIIDAEDDRVERKRRQRKGIAAMPVVNGKKVSAKTGNAYGRPAAVEKGDFEKFLKKQKDGEMSIQECCKQLGISRATWYNKVKEVG